MKVSKSIHTYQNGNKKEGNAREDDNSNLKEQGIKGKS